MRTLLLLLAIVALIVPAFPPDAIEVPTSETWDFSVSPNVGESGTVLDPMTSKRLVSENGVMTFDSHNYLTGDLPTVQNSDSFSITVLVNPTETHGKIQKMIVDKANDEFGRDFRLDWIRGQFRFVVFDTNDELTQVRWPELMETNRWYLLKAEYSKETKTISLTVDGGEPVTAPFYGTRNVSNVRFAVGGKSEIRESDKRLQDVSFVGAIARVTITSE